MILDRRQLLKTFANLTLTGSGLTLLHKANIFPSFANAQETSFFRIGTASVGGTYFPIAGLLASAISNPPGSRPCELGGSCGVPGMIAVAISTQGSVYNAGAIARGDLESGFSQADIAYWAWRGEAVFNKKEPLTNLRTIANLYPEAIQLVVRKDSDITSVKDLRGKKIGVGPEGSGTYVDALMIMDAYGLSPKNVELSTQRVDIIIEMVRLGELDGLFLVAGTPTPVISDLSAQIPIKLIPLEGKEIQALTKKAPFFSSTFLPRNLYENTEELLTLSVGAQWLTSVDMDDDLIYDITRSLWHPNTLSLLASGHPKGAQISLSTALHGIGVPLHLGAYRYYQESSIPIPLRIQELQENPSTQE